MAGGIALFSFGGGGAAASYFISKLLEANFVPPVFAGSQGAIEVITNEAGVQFTEYEGVLREVVLATATNLISHPELSEGFYLVGTGDSGASMSFLTLGIGYFTAMSIGSMFMRVPRAGWKPTNWTPPADALTANVDFRQVLKTPQYYMLWTAVFGNACAGMAILSTGRSIVTEIFSVLVPAAATSAFAAKYIGSLSLANAGGRAFWAVTSDKIGRKSTYAVFGSGCLVLAGIPYYVLPLAMSSGGIVPLYIFTGGTLFLVVNYGGMFAVLPSYISDLFGEKHTGAIHGRVLTAWTAAGLTGPTLVSTLRAQTYNSEVDKLISLVDPDVFESTFAAPITEYHHLVEAKTVTIPRLLEIAPAGTIDPSPFLYNNTCYAMTGTLAVAAVANACITKVDRKHFTAVDGTSGLLADSQRKTT